MWEWFKYEVDYCRWHEPASKSGCQSKLSASDRIRVERWRTAAVLPGRPFEPASAPAAARAATVSGLPQWPAHSPARRALCERAPSCEDSVVYRGWRRTSITRASLVRPRFINVVVDGPSWRHGHLPVAARSTTSAYSSFDVARTVRHSRDFGTTTTRRRWLLCARRVNIIVIIIWFHIYQRAHWFLSL